MDFGFQIGFLDSIWISGFQNGFLDFKVDFWISFESLVFVVLKIQLKYTHEQSMNHIPLSLDANRIQCTGTSPLGSAYCVFVDCHTYTCTILRLSYIFMYKHLQLHHLRRMTFVPNRRSVGYKGHSFVR